MLSETYTSPVSEYVIAAGKVKSPPFPFATDRLNARIRDPDVEYLCNLSFRATSGNFANDTGSLVRLSLVVEQLKTKRLAIIKARTYLPVYPVILLIARGVSFQVRTFPTQLRWHRGLPEVPLH